MELHKDHDIEMNPLGRARSAPEGNPFAPYGGRSIISSAGARPGSSRSVPGGTKSGSGTAAGAGGMRARVDRFIDSFKREDGSSERSLRRGSRDIDGYHDDISDGYDAGRRPPAGTAAAAAAATGVVRGNGGARYYDLRAANIRTASSLLARELKGRHLQMIAISGSIGTGLFVASGQALSQGGPASVLVAYLLVGVMLWCTVQALGEMAVVFPVAGSFSAYSTRFLDPSWGFAMGWNYALQWIVVLPLEIIAGALTIRYWNPELNSAIFVTVFLLTIVAINLSGIKGYGEAEFIFAIVKVTAVVGFILLGIVINIGGTPTSGYIGGKYWQDPGAFNNGFKGLCTVFVKAAFAFAGTELVGLAAAETANPRKSLPTAIKQVFWRITLFYIVSLVLVGLLVPHDEARLLGATSMADASASPFVIAIESAGATILPSVMNGVILVSVLSVGNSSVFGSTRTLAALADQGQAPRIFGYVDRRGRPLVAVLAVPAALSRLGIAVRFWERLEAGKEGERRRERERGGKEGGGGGGGGGEGGGGGGEEQEEEQKEGHGDRGMPVRFTPKAVHDASFEGVEAVVGWLDEDGEAGADREEEEEEEKKKKKKKGGGELLDRIVMVRRGGEVVYGNERAENGWVKEAAALAALRRERARGLTDEERKTAEEGIRMLKSLGDPKADREVEEIEELMAGLGIGDRTVSEMMPFDAADFVKPADLGRDDIHP